MTLCIINTENIHSMSLATIRIIYLYLLRTVGVQSPSFSEIFSNHCIENHYDYK